MDYTFIKYYINSHQYESFMSHVCISLKVEAHPFQKEQSRTCWSILLKGSH